MNTRERLVTMLALVCCLISIAPAATVAEDVPSFIWWEAEKPLDSNFPDTSFFRKLKPDEAAKLSGNDWLAADGNRFGPALYAEYEVSVPEETTYNLWVRKFWKHGPFRWRFDDREWAECTRDCALADNVTLKLHLGANWVYLGPVELAKGSHTFRFETLEAVEEEPGTDVPPAIDETVISTAAPWCTIDIPRTVAVGQTIPITVTYKGVSPRGELGCDLHWMKENAWGGVIAPARPRIQVEGDGTHVFRVKVENMGKDMLSVHALVYLRDNGEIRKPPGMAKSANVPVSAGAPSKKQTGAGSIAMDAFVLTPGMFVPRGKLKPGETSGRSEPGWFAWEPPGDPLSDTCPIDLRHLNEKAAGQSGFVKQRGDGFALGDGTPVRFVEKGTCDPFMHRSLVDQRARRLAKYGVNMCRTGFALHYPRWAKGTKGNTAEMAKFNDTLDRIHYMIAAMKKQGIYTWLRLYWNTGQTEMFFDEAFQEHFLKYADHILNTPNPYTGLPMSRDPAVAVVAIQNENNLLFWTFNPERIESRPRELIERAFGQWVTAKYGSIDKALETWGPGNPPVKWYKDVSEDHPEQGRLGLYGIGHLTGLDWAAPQRNPGRAGDQLQFMVEAQKGAYEKIVNAFHERLGLKNLISCCNWKTADPQALSALEHYSYTPGDVISRNIYYDVHYDPKPKRFYAVDLDDTYTPCSSLLPPELPSSLTIAHMGDMPYSVTENNWCRPNCYRAEWPFLVAAYGSMLGMDAWSFNGEGGPLWNTTMEVWDVNSPSVLGQLPAVSTIIRRGYVKEAPVAVTDHLSLADLYAFKGCSIYGLKGQDALWVAKIGDKESDQTVFPTRVDPLAFFVGRVKRIITDDGPSRLETIDLAPYIDREKQVVRSLTGEVTWDFGHGIATLDTPCAQGVCGFLRTAGRIPLGDIVIDADNEYGSILVVSLDGRPLKTSRRILIQAGTEDRTYGFRTEDLGNGKRRIADLGDYPLVVRDVHAEVTVMGDGVEAARVLDGNGNLTDRRAATDASAEGLCIQLPTDSLYTLVTR